MIIHSQCLTLEVKLFKFDADKIERGEISKETRNLQWEDCEEKIDVVALASKEPILFYDEVVLYEDELADIGVSLLTVKVRVMPTSWFLLFVTY
ncbi:hypothetical protein ACFX11_035095 [Malus domestica]